MKRILTKLKKALTNPRRVAIYLIETPLVARCFSDKQYVKIKYRLVTGKKLDLKSPQSFSEKLQWLKLYDRDDEYTRMVDKYDAREYIANIVGEEYLIPLLGVWDGFDDIDFDSLPEQFVLKCTHDSGGVVVCRDKSQLDIGEARKKLTTSMKKNYFYRSREWPYKNIKPRIIAEKYMEDSSGGLTDYKFMCFGGKVKCCFTCTERFSEDGLRVTFFDNEWKQLPFTRKYPASELPVEKPVSYDKMRGLAEKLSEGLPFVRVDFYEVDGNPYLGELTFFPGSGLEKFQPEEWDYILGSWIELPTQK